jgi:hypothetical protein
MPALIIIIKALYPELTRMCTAFESKPISGRITNICKSCYIWGRQVTSSTFCTLCYKLSFSWYGVVRDIQVNFLSCVSNYPSTRGSLDVFLKADVHFTVVDLPAHHVGVIGLQSCTCCRYSGVIELPVKRGSIFNYLLEASADLRSFQLAVVYLDRNFFEIRAVFWFKVANTSSYPD